MNELKHAAEFRKALENYNLSDSAKQIAAATRLVLLVGPSSAGRNTIINELLKTGKYHVIISDTTRQPRSNNGVMEQNGREYWFRSEEEMLKDVESGEFLEAEIIHGQQVSGTSIRELKKASEAHKIAINDVDIGGIENILRAKPDTIAVMILPPDFETWLHRLDARGAMPADEHKRRLETAARIFKAALEDPRLKLVVNDELAAAVTKVHTIATTGTEDAASQQRARALAGQLYQDTQAYLARE